MSYILIKADRDRDLYVLWSTVVDNVLAVGSRADFRGEPDAAYRLNRADYIGTSAQPSRFGPAFGSFEDQTGFIVSNLPGRLAQSQRWLPRQNLAAYAEAVLAEDCDAIERLTEIPR